MPDFVEKLFSCEAEGDAASPLVISLQMMFARMTRSNSKFVDPTEVLKSLKTEIGGSLQIDGEQQDVREFHTGFIESLSKALLGPPPKDTQDGADEP